MNINSNFDGGNIRVVNSQDPSNIELEINKDNNSEFYQWFYFRLTGAEGIDCRLNITNAKGAAYLDGWNGYQAVASYDRQFWFRVPTKFENGVLTIEHMPEYESVYYAYFAPYSMERLADFISWTLSDSKVRLKTLGQSLDGQDIDQLVVGSDDAGKKKIWIQARQHPGETQGSWWMEGFVQRLLDEDEPISRYLLDRAVFYITPNINPDGSRRGHLRTNAAGANLNREWMEPSMERSPEVYLMRQQMEKIGVNFCLDVHGDEGLPYNFIAGSEGTSVWNEHLANLHDTFGETYMAANPDFQTEFGYPKDNPGEANITVCTNYITETFKCCAITLEMPFKDTADTPQPIQGWSPERCIKLGESAIDAIYAIVDDL
ncbi:M14-type cytosolic carboxypeptidase [Aliikangiella sp. G2MR2-5]|uniref:M14 family metallopeptidase n=1 Tax=Aliikangiella sp. G2MR2-5 TaxID=2788943 RepID=UPI0018AA6A03|nr:M14-type cytosolic carboxypeptidase [Aliikangiella sp. G2MR2-5]